MPKACRHVTCLSERRINSASVLGDGIGWVCLTCFREWEGKTKFVQHERSKNHPLVWVTQEEYIYCVQCGEQVDVENLNAKNKENAEACLKAIKNMMARKEGNVVCNKFDSTCEDTSLLQEKLDFVDGETGQSFQAKAPLPPGLHNLGNTCFMNSALQSLASIDSFQSQSDHLGPLGKSLFDLLETMRNSSASLSVPKNRKKVSTSSINPSHFFDNLSKRNEQQDSHDFLRLLFNALDDENDEFESKKSKSTPVHRDVFGGLVAARVDCKKCQNRTKKSETCLDLSLALNHDFSIDNSFESLTLDEGGKNLVGLIEAWQRPQKLEDENAFACENCFKKGVEGQTDEIRKIVYSPATCRYSLEETPKCLLIHLQRFSISKMPGRRKKSSFGYGKDHREVRIPPKLTIGDATFTIRSMIIHEGATADSGHYIAVVFRQGHWYRISDSSVSPISETTAHSYRHAYMIFYQKEDSPIE